MRLKTDDRRLGILAAAKTVFLERGYEAASMMEVSVRAGGSKQTLYNYFASKEELFAAVMLDDAATMIEPPFSDYYDGRDLVDALNRFAVACLKSLASPTVLAYRRVVCAEGAKSDIGKRIYECGRKRGWDIMANDFARAMDEGRMRRADPWQAVTHFSALLEAGPVLRLLEGAIDELGEDQLYETAQAAVDVFCRAYEVVTDA